MKRPITTDSIQTSTPRLGTKYKLLRASLLAAAIAVGTAFTFASVVPVARAIDGQPGMTMHESFFAAMHGGHTPDEIHAHFDKVMTDAGVGDAQKQQIHAIMKDAMTAEHTDMARFHDSMARLKTLLVADRIDNVAVAEVRAEQDRLMLATSHRLSGTMMAVAKVLTPEQRAKLGAQIDQMMAAHGMPQHGG